MSGKNNQNSKPASQKSTAPKPEDRKDLMELQEATRDSNRLMAADEKQAGEKPTEVITDALPIAAASKEEAKTKAFAGAQAVWAMKRKSGWPKLRMPASPLGPTSISEQQGWHERHRVIPHRTGQESIPDEYDGYDANYQFHSHLVH